MGWSAIKSLEDWSDIAEWPFDCKNLLDSVDIWNNRGRDNWSVTSGVRALFVLPDCTKTLWTFFPRIMMAGGDYFEGGDYFKFRSLEVVPKIFCFIIPLNKKWSYQVIWTWASKFGPLINFQCQYPRRQNLNRQWSNSLDQAPLQLDREVIKGEDGEKGGNGWLFEEGD